jgi:hypothetical protein
MRVTYLVNLPVYQDFKTHDAKNLRFTNTRLIPALYLTRNPICNQGNDVEYAPSQIPFTYGKWQGKQWGHASHKEYEVVSNSVCLKNVLARKFLVNYLP